MGAAGRPVLVPRPQGAGLFNRETGTEVVAGTASYSAVRLTKRDAVPGVASVEGLRPVTMGRSMNVIDEELQVLGPTCRRREVLMGTRCR